MSKRVSNIVSALGSNCRFEYDVVNDREVIIPEVNRIGLELTGFSEHSEPKRILIIGNKEMAYILRLKQEQIVTVFNLLLTEETPCLFVTRDLEIPQTIIDVAKSKDFPIVRWNGTTSRLLLKLFAILDEWFAPTTTLHGTLLQIYGTGVLIKGPSGIGKSEIALELIKKGHNLVSDDSVKIIAYDNRLIGSAPELIKNMIEIRGLGIIDATKLFGYSIVSDSSPIEFVVELSRWDNKKTYERLGNNIVTENILDVEVEKIDLPVSEGRSMADVIEASVTNFKLREKGIDVAAEFHARIRNILTSSDNND